MPELPEVETVCRGLLPHLAGQHITQLATSGKNLRLPWPTSLDREILGKAIANVTRRAKYIQIIFVDDTVLVVHLGMSGKLILSPTLPTTHHIHDHMWMELSNNTALVFNDPRRFGLIALTDKKSLPQHKLFKHLGIEPISDACTGSWLYAQCRHKKTSIKQLLMDASTLVGVGNIYASESLFRAEILPQRPAGSITQEEAERLVGAVKTVLEAAIASGGSTLRDYVGADGNAGYFQHHFSVYGKEGKPCEHCGTAITRIVQSARSTFYCPTCQH